MDCTIIICTHNRADSLRVALRSVSEQEFKQGSLEILVVDNCSTDETRMVVQSFVTRSRHPLRYLYEERLGVSHARNCGVRVARGDIVLFIDDDALPLGADWAAQLVRTYADPLVGAAGGDIEPLWPDGQRPAWLHPFLLPPLGLTCFDHGAITELHYPNYVWCANLSFRRRLVEKYGGFLHELGWSAGKMAVSGEESELCLRLERAGMKILYVPGAAVLHAISPECLTETSLMERAGGHGRADATIDRLHAPRTRIVLKFFRKGANVALHSAGAFLFTCLRWRKMRLFCRYNVHYAGAYLLRMAGLK